MILSHHQLLFVATCHNYIRYCQQRIEENLSVTLSPIKIINKVQSSYQEFQIESVWLKILRVIWHYPLPCVLLDKPKLKLHCYNPNPTTTKSQPQLNITWVGFDMKRTVVHHPPPPQKLSCGVAVTVRGHQKKILRGGKEGGAKKIGGED